MKSGSFRRFYVRPILLGCLAFTFTAPRLSAQSLSALDAIVQAHQLDPLPPISVQITGMVERNGKTEPFRILATRDEELRMEYGSEGKDTFVSSPKVMFHTDGRTLTFPSVVPRYNQLDITGLFLVQQLRNRAVQVEATGESRTLGTAPVQHIAVRSERKKGYGALPRIEDRMDLYVSESGLLAAIARSFYQGRPEAYTETTIFSDYRRVGEQLLPHRIEVYLQKNLRQTFRVESYQFDVPVDRDLFQPRRPQ
jgi:outer membrane lipoprotein-sorting protein